MTRDRHRRSAILLGLVGLGLIFKGPEAAAGDWPRFLGPNGNNVSDEIGLLARWPTNGLSLLWEKSVGSGYSAPSVAGHSLVLHHRVGGEEVVEAMEAETGRSLWRHADPSGFADPYGYNNGPRSTPSLQAGRCYAMGATGRLLCLDLETGKLIWQRDTARDWNVPEPFFGVGTSPLIEEGRLLVMVGGQPNSTVVALDSTSGRTLWENVGRTNWQGARTFGWTGEAPYQWTGEEKLASYSSPVAATIHGQRQILSLTRQGLVSLNPTNGAVNFSRWFQSPVNESVNAICPVVRDDEVFLSAAYYHIGSLLLRVNPDGKSFAEVWRSPARTGAPESAERSGALPVLELHWATPVLHEGFLYAFSGRNEPDASFRCVEFGTGRLRWQRDERWRPHTTRQPTVYGRGSLILADGKLIVLGEGGKLGLFQPNPRQPEEVTSWQVPQLHYPCWTSPVLARGRLYLRSEDRLLCFDLRRRTP